MTQLATRPDGSADPTRPIPRPSTWLPARPTAGTTTAAAGRPGRAPVRRARRSLRVSPWWMLAAFAAASLASENATAMVLATGYLLLVPGDLLRQVARVQVGTLPVRLVLAVGGSLSVLLGCALGADLLGALLGASRPLTHLSLLICVTGVTAVLILLRTRGPDREVPTPLHRVDVRAVAGTVVGLTLAAAGVNLLDNGYGPWLLGTVLALAATALLVAALRTGPTWVRIQPWLAYAFAAAVGWSFSLRSTFLYGFDIQQEWAVFQRTHEAGAWVHTPGDPFSAMLSITVLPTAIAEIGGIPDLAVFKVLYPLIFALYPMATLLVLRRWASPRPAILVTVASTLVPSSLWQMPAIARQEIGLTMYVTVLVVLFCAEGRRRRVVRLAGILGLALVVSHYSTAYVTILLLVAAVFGAALVRRWRPDGFGRPHVPAALAALLLVAAGVWNVGITHSTSNLSRTASSVSTQGIGLKDDTQGSLLERWLDGTTNTSVGAREFFVATQEVAASRPWLLPYPSDVQRDFAPVDASAGAPDAVAAGLGPVTTLGYLVLRQGINVLLVLGTLFLALAVLRRRTGVIRGKDLDLAAMAVAMLAVTAVMRSSSALSLAYNPERLALQAAPLLGVGAALLLDRRPAARIAVRLRRAPLVAAALLLGALLLSATGLLGQAVSGQAGNLATVGEHHERFYLRPTDLAAARWLNRWRGPDNLVFTDRYGSLVVQSTGGPVQGIIDLTTPSTLDQRGFVYATHANVVDGRVRSLAGGQFSTYAFPGDFFDTYKARVYTNGSAEVYK